MDDEYPPPLEDHADEVAAIRLRREPIRARVEAVKQSATTKFSTSTNDSDNDNASKSSVPLTTATATTARSKANGGMFSGMQGGFFGPAKPQSQPRRHTSTSSNDSKDDDIPLIRATATEPRDASLRFSEVQSAMSPATGINLNTPDFLAKLQTQPALLRSLTNPRIVAAVSEIQRDPKAAMAKYGRDEEVASFIVEFTKLMGAHFEGAQSQSPPPPKSAKREVSQERVNQWLSDPALRAVLNDPSTSAILSAIQADRSQFARHASDPRIRLLVKAGILEVPPDYKL